MYAYIAIAVLILIAGFVLRAAKGAPRTLDTLSGALADLLKRGYDGGFLIISISYSRRFLQIRKYIRQPGNYGIELAFPKAKWSLSCFDAVRDLCRRRGLDSRVSDEGVLDFLYADFGTNVSEANDCVKEILADIFGVSSKATLFVKLENATVEDELIETP